MGYTSYSRKGRQQRNIKSDTAASISLSPSSHNDITSSPVVRSSLSRHESPVISTTSTPVNTSPLAISPIVDSPSQRLTRSASRRSGATKLSDLNVFDVEDLEIDYIPSFKKRSTYKVSSLVTSSMKNTSTSTKHKPNFKDKGQNTIETVHIEPVKLNGINDLDTRFYIESNEKPTWSPSKQLKSPIKLSSSKQSSPKLPKRTLCFDPPPDTKLEKKFETFLKPPPIMNSELEAWSLFNDVEIDCKPKLISKLANTIEEQAPSTSNTKTDRSRIQKQNHNVIDEMYEKLTTTPTKKKNINPVSSKRDSSFSDFKISPKRQKTYSLIRSFRADITEEDEQEATTVEEEEQEEDDDIEKELHNQAEIQDINQLRINGINSKFNEEFEYLIEGLNKKDKSLTRFTILEICSKIMENGEFYENLILSDIPDLFWQSMLCTDENIVQFCFLVICYKLRQNDQLLLKLSRNSELLNNLLLKTSQMNADSLKLNLSKVSQSVFNELFKSIEHEFETADTKFFYYLFIKTFKDYIKFDFKLVQLGDNTNEDELFVNLSILENMLQQDDNVPKYLFQELIYLIKGKASTNQSLIMRSCQISALKSLILLSLSQPAFFNDTDIFNDLFSHIQENFNTDDNLIKNIILLQLGLLLNLADILQTTGKELEILSLVELNLENGENVYISGYLSLILGSLCMMQKLNLESHQRQVLIKALFNFEKILVDDEDLILGKVKHVLKYVTT